MLVLGVERKYLTKMRDKHRRRRQGGKLNKQQKALLATGLTALGLAASTYGAQRYGLHKANQYHKAKISRYGYQTNPFLPQ